MRGIRAGMTLLAIIVGMGATAAEGQERESRRAEAAPRAPERGWIGISFHEVNGGEGRVVIDAVAPDSPAQSAGIQPGDTLVLWNGRSDVLRAVSARRLEPGDTLRVRVRRAGERDRELALVAGRAPNGLRGLVEVVRGRRGDGGDVLIVRPDALDRHIRVFADSLAVHADSLHRRLRVMLRDSLGPRLRELERMELPEIRIHFPEGRGGARGEALFDVGRRGVAGAEFAELNEGLSNYFGTSRGVLILRVAPETPAARAGLQAGDVVVEVNDREISGIPELRREIARSDTRGVELKILRQGKRREVQMRWEE